MKGRMLAMLLLASPAAILPAAHAAEPRQQAIALIDHLRAGEFSAAPADFDARLGAALPPAKLDQVWTTLQAQLGPLRERGEAHEEPRDGGTLVTLPLHFEKAAMQARIVVDGDGRIAGFLIVPATAPAPAVPAGAGYREQDVQVGDLPGTLALPDGKGPFPALVLVPGSGPNDRDETVGPNKPFLDLARGLAAQGVAVLRYDKRTFAKPESMAGARLSVDGETTDDAVAAIAALAAHPAIDAHRIYVLGHSQGGLLAPRIAARSGHVAGLVLWAAPARPLLDLMIDQVRYVQALPGAQPAQGQAAVAATEAAVRSIRQRPPAGAADDAIVLLAPARYWRELDRVDPIADLARLDLPVLWLQGGRDFQVTRPDWSLWKQALDGNARATEYLYPALDHLGIAGSGPSSPAGYQRPGHVDPRLIADVATWVRAQR